MKSQRLQGNPSYALLSDDIVIADSCVADIYQSVINTLSVTISLLKSLISDIGGSEFSKRFRICYRDWICRSFVLRGAGVIIDLDKNVATGSKLTLKEGMKEQLLWHQTQRELHQRFRRVKILLHRYWWSEGEIDNVDYKLSRGKDNPKTIGSKPRTVRMKSAKMCPADESRPRPNLVSDR
ncbi:hypothetical protein M9H77_23646 [Catharanthus roseus]|uniref:Uncharacterized protein n=1 Tax=Catharanthus roseus TaxID=4058 RepID=A0ACC0AWQ6_CATRO|nr:hypothetical protein M9H77_23646 [Catharanthus roseus]